MAEEHRCQHPEGHRPCVNNCGFFGSSATMNLCSKCYHDKQQQQQNFLSSSSSSSTAVSLPHTAAILVENSGVPALAVPDVRSNITESSPVEESNKPKRCLVCKKRVGLTGFKCRCGTMYCGVHRYPEKHNCGFDFKKLGREEIARANPLVIANKLNKI